MLIIPELLTFLAAAETENAEEAGESAEAAVAEGDDS